MDRNKVAKRDGKARSALNVSEQRTYMHTEYDIVLGNEQIEPTGRLVIARLKPRVATTGILPEFVLRWDEKANSLDVDLVNGSRAEAREFKRGTSNYYGHHPKKVGSGPRVFEVNVGWHGQQVYHGKISFGLAREVEAAATIGLNVAASMSSSKGNG